MAVALLMGTLLCGGSVGCTGDEVPSTPIREVLDEEEGRLRHLYGVTPVDVARLADVARDLEPSIAVASFPGRASLNGPLLTRTDTFERWLPASVAQEASTESIGGGWYRIRWTDSGEGPTPSSEAPQLSEARIHTRRGDATSTCRRVSLARFQCDQPSWAFTGRHRARVGGREQTCIWSHPLDGRTTVVDYGAVAPPPEGRAYVLETALDDRVLDASGAVDVDIRVGERTIAHRQPAEKGWRRLELPEFDTPTRLILEISAEQVGRRHFCYRFATR